MLNRLTHTVLGDARPRHTEANSFPEATKPANDEARVQTQPLHRTSEGGSGRGWQPQREFQAEGGGANG